MAALIDTILRGTLFLWLVIALGLTGSLVAGSNHENPQVNFAVFAAAFGLLFGVLYGLAGAFVEFLALPIVMAVIDFLDFVFLFAAATAIAAAIRVHSCSNTSYLKSNSINQGSSGRCRKAQASVAFLYFGVFTSIALMVYSILGVVSGGAFGLPSRRNAVPRTGVPTMSQV